MNLRKILAALTLSVTLSACSGNGAATSTPATVTVTVTATETQTPEGQPGTETQESDQPVTAEGLKLGQSAQLRRVKLTALQLKSIQRPEGPARAVLVRACVSEDVEFSWMPWALIDADSGTYPASNSMYESDPRPQFPTGAQRTVAGECVKGWIVFDMEESTKVVKIRYANSIGEVASWSI